jgi:phosphatidate phosphatase APP1
MADEFTVVSDIDDVVRITKVYVPTTGLKNSFAEPYVNIAGMPELYAHWMQTLPGAALHFDTTTPLELSMPAYCSVSALTVRKARTYVDYLFANYPLGSLDMRPINLTEPSDVLDARSKSLQRIFQTFPNRKFVLVGDTSSSTLLTAYPEIAQMVGLSISSRDLLTRTQYPSQLACIFIRNTTATDSDDRKHSLSRPSGPFDAFAKSCRTTPKPSRTSTPASTSSTSTHPTSTTSISPVANASTARFRRMLLSRIRAGHSRISGTAIPLYRVELIWTDDFAESHAVRRELRPRTGLDEFPARAFALQRGREKACPH